MSDTAVATDNSAVSEADEPTTSDHHDHPSETQYWVVFVVLAFITAVEVLWSYLDVSGPTLVVPLILMMLVKFAVVAGVFMHLYFDIKIRNGQYFTMAFASGLVLAMGVYAILLASFDFKI